MEDVMNILRVQSPGFDAENQSDTVSAVIAYFTKLLEKHIQLGYKVYTILVYPLYVGSLLQKRNTRDKDQTNSSVQIHLCMQWWRVSPSHYLTNTIRSVDYLPSFAIIECSTHPNCAVWYWVDHYKNAGPIHSPFHRPGTSCPALYNFPVCISITPSVDYGTQ